MSGEVIRTLASHGKARWFEFYRKRPSHPAVQMSPLILELGKDKRPCVMLTTSPSSGLTDQRKYGP